MLDTEHITKAEIDLSMDGHLPGDELAVVIRHLMMCEECRKAALEVAGIRFLIDEILTMPPLQETTAPCLSAILVAQYACGTVTEAQRAVVIEHISRCYACRQHLVEVMIPEATHVKPVAVAENSTMPSSETWLGNLLGHLEDIVEAFQTGLESELRVVVDDAMALLEGALISHTPHLEPVFGAGRPTVLGPFGKVAFPVTFEWHSDTASQGRCSYQVFIRETVWSATTRASGLTLSRKETGLEYGQNYNWKITVTKAGNEERRWYGQFQTIDRESEQRVADFRQALSVVQDERDRLVVLGSLLEAMELFVDAIASYREAYEMAPSAGLAYRIAVSYDQLGLHDLREKWSQKNRCSRD